MPTRRAQFIGSFSTKHPERVRSDIQIVADPEELGNLKMRLHLQCDNAMIGHVAWQVFDEEEQEWIFQAGPPPYNGYDLGAMGQPQAPVLLPTTNAADHIFHNANWLHQLVFSMVGDHTYFKYQSADHPDRPPLYFKKLRFQQQIQSSTRAEDILA